MKRLSVFCLLALLGACGSSEEPLQPCEDPVLITVDTAGAATEFTWSPACLISRVTVLDSAGAVLWDVQATASNIAPAVTYGITPPSATTNTAPATLVDGRSYAVGLYRATGVQPSDVELLSALAFRP